MPELDPTDATALLGRARGGDRAAGGELLELLLGELRQIAHYRMSRQRPDHTLQTTALIHEAWLRMFGGAEEAFAGRSHFLRLASTAMRSVLVDHARAKLADKRGGGGQRVDLPDDVPDERSTRTEVLDLDEALAKLAELDPEQAQVAEMRCFGGLSCAEVADVLGVSKRTIERSWKASKAFLQRELAASASTAVGGEEHSPEVRSPDS